MAKKNKDKQGIRFVQAENQASGAFIMKFGSFDEARKWVALDKTEEYGDALAYGGTFEGLDPEEERELREMTFEDALHIVANERA
jgi:hypothetical protein